MKKILNKVYTVLFKAIQEPDYTPMIKERVAFIENNIPLCTNQVHIRACRDAVTTLLELPFDYILVAKHIAILNSKIGWQAFKLRMKKQDNQQTK